MDLLTIEQNNATLQQNQQTMQQNATREQLQANERLQRNRMEALQKREETSRRKAQRDQRIAAPSRVARRRTESRYERKKRESAQKKIYKAIQSAETATDVAKKEKAQTLTSHHTYFWIGKSPFEVARYQMSEEQRQEWMQKERSALEKKLKAIDLQEEACLMIADQAKEEGYQYSRDILRSMEHGEHYAWLAISSYEDGMWDDAYSSAVEDMPKEFVDRRRVLRIKIDALGSKVEALDGYCQLLEPGSKEHIKMVKMKETAIVQKARLDKQRKVLGTWNETERTRGQNTIDRHARYERAAAVVSKFRKSNPCSVEGASIIHNGITYVNIGRVALGGTKPMYRFKEISTGKEYLFKEAVNCLGFYKPEGAIVTEIGSILQNYILPETSVKAFAVRGENGEVLGSLQEKIKEYKRYPFSHYLSSDREPIDLYKYQAKRESNPDADADGPDGLTTSEKNTILCNHVLDWVLCNFDTKGENFIVNSQGGLVAIDKEESFYKLSDEGAQHMSADYKAHTNDTIYNTIFKDFANNRIDLDLDFVREYVEKLQIMPVERYRAIFEPLLTLKCKTQEERDAMFQKINQRRRDLLKEYRRFFGQLIQERNKAILRDGAKSDAYTDRVNKKGHFLFKKDYYTGYYEESEEIRENEAESEASMLL